MPTTVLGTSALVVALALTANANAQQLSTTAPITAEPPIYIAPQAFIPTVLTITDTEGTPIEGARVSFTGADLEPSETDTLITDSAGQILRPATAPAPLADTSVTIDAPGFVRTTYLALSPSITTLQVRHASGSKTSPKRFELKGDTSGFGDLENDGVFDMGLVLQGVPRAELSRINLQTMISPEMDTVSVFGQTAEIPSNTTIPSQTESYIIPLHFEKSDYRLYLPHGGPWTVATLHAQVPFKATADAMKKGTPFDKLFNTITFVGGTVSSVNLTQPTTTQDFSVDQMEFKKSLRFKAPAYDKSLILRAVAMSSFNGSFYPTDVKNVAPSASIQLAVPPGATNDGLILAAYQKNNAQSVGPESDQFSAVAVMNNQPSSFDPLPLVKPPTVNQNQLVLDTPTVPANLTPIMTYGALSIVTRVSTGSTEMETKEAVWDVWAPAWVNKLDLPQQPLPKIDRTTQTLRWEVGFDAEVASGTTPPTPGPGELEHITHVTRSAVDLP